MPTVSAADLARRVAERVARDDEPDHDLRPAGRVRVIEVLRAHLDEHLVNRPRLSFQEMKSLSHIAKCRTSALGIHIQQCGTCDYYHQNYNSCRNRHCPQCGGGKRRKWLEGLQSRMLPTAAYQAVCTVPHDLSPLMLGNREVTYRLLFSCSWEALRELVRDRHGTEIGAISVLHTWNQVLDHHAHVHLVVPAGGWHRKKNCWVSFLRWCKAKRKWKSYLVNVKALSALFRGKFLAGLKEAWKKGELQLAGPLAELASAPAFESFLSSLYEKDWVVHLTAPKSADVSPENLCKYLCRYVAGVAISDRRLISHEKGQVTFWARQAGHDGVTSGLESESDGNSPRRRASHPYTLSGAEFVRRYGMHILPKGFTRVRYFGFYSPAQKPLLAQCREALTPTPPASSASTTTAAASTKGKPLPCPKCKTGELVIFQDYPPPSGLLLLQRLGRLKSRAPHLADWWERLLGGPKAPS